MERDTNKAILIVSIENANRISAVDTLDYFLVEIQDYKKSVEALKKYEESGDPDDIVTTTSSAIAILNNAGIDFEHVIEGRRFFFDNGIVSTEYDDCE